MMRGLRGLRGALIAGLVLAFALFATHDARAFCGFFVSGADAKLTNNASMVVMMRSGTKTVLAMQNEYDGPPENFALVIPVPVVLQKDNVRTLTKDLFQRVDSLTAPRLVEYWERDPCAYQREQELQDLREGGTGTRAKGEEGSMGNRFASRVTVEAKFAVGEYEIVILGAKDSAGLDGWLREEKYRIPEGAEEALRPYVAAGSKFFVAKVDVKKVEINKGKARLSPLRFHYDSESFTLPVRLGLLSSPGTQDVIVHVLAKERYELASHPNAVIPTNLEVDDTVRADFPRFYAALFDKTLETTPRAVVTEYSWSASSCDPCPTEPLQDVEAKLLGSDVMAGKIEASDLVVTRLHARYTKASLGDDLVFRAAPPLEGGREGDIQGWTSPQRATTNNFQARYVIRHRWKGAVRCTEPSWEEWGGPPQDRRGGGGGGPNTDLQTTPRDEKPTESALAAYLRSDIPQLGVKATKTVSAIGTTSSSLRMLRGFGIGGFFGLVVVIAAVVMMGKKRGHS